MNGIALLCAICSHDVLTERSVLFPPIFVYEFSFVQGNNKKQEFDPYHISNSI